MAASVSSLYRRSADTITVSSFHSHLTHPGALIVRRAIYALIRTAASDRHESWTRGSTSARFLNNVARNSLFGSALKDQKAHDFNTSPSKTEGTAGELRAKFRGRGSISGWNEAGSDLCEVRDLRVRQFDKVEGAQLDAEASAPARDDHGLVVQAGGINE